MFRKMQEQETFKEEALKEFNIFTKPEKLKQNIRFLKENKEFDSYIFYKLYADYLICKNVHEKRNRFEDREVLERIIFPFMLAHFNPKKILDVGRSSYQKFYNEFFLGRELITIDKNPQKKNLGSENHIIGDITNIREFIEKETVDLVILNGVIGWGLNKKEDIEKAIFSIFEIMKKNSLMIIGWNDITDLKPVKIENIEALKNFEKYYFPPLETYNFKSYNGSHTYSFFLKK